MKAVLGLENGQYYVGDGFGAEGQICGEVVFSTQMLGYMGALTDPSYHGQMLLFTFPQIGNYGVDLNSFQSPNVCARGLIVHELCEKPAHDPTLRSYCEANGVMGISGIDTRMLTVQTREIGTLMGCLMVGTDDGDAAIEEAQKAPPLSDLDLIGEVSCPEMHHIPGSGKKIAVIDLGIKKSILDNLVHRSYDLYVFPHTATPDDIGAVDPDALFISNGPGDPTKATDAIKTVKESIGEMPIFGVCMGNQICALALSGRTEKMKFGHRGDNQPVRYQDGTIAITSQNHGYVVDGESLPEGTTISYVNCNDGTLEGFEDPYLKIFSVQFQPEALAGSQSLQHHFFDSIVRGNI
jgi:carbamoyl-phosphate synthase small subunit